MESTSQGDCGRRTTIALHLRVLGAFLLLIFLLAAAFYFYADVNVWEHLRESGELRKAHYSETVYIESIFRTRANTWSNLAFVLVGLYALALGERDRRKGFAWLSAHVGNTPPALTLLFGVACCYLGIGSGIFHASLTRWGQQLDVASMYPPMLALMTMLLHRNGLKAFNLHALRTEAFLTLLLIAAVCVAAIYFYVYKWSMSSGRVLPLHILVLVLFYALDRLYFRPHARIGWLVASFLALVAGVICRQRDVAGQFSGPDAWYQGHAFWHVLCALSLGLGWWYIRSVRSASRNDEVS